MKIFKYIILSVIIFIASILIITSLTAINYIKPYISNLVKDETGRELEIKGDIFLRLIPAPELIINKIKLSNPQWAKSEDFIEAELINLKIAYLPALKGSMQIDNIILKGIIVNYEKNKYDKTSLDFELKSASKENIKEDGNRINYLPFGSDISIKFSDININYSDEINEQKHHVKINDLNLTGNEKLSDINFNAQIDKTLVNLEIKTGILRNILIAEIIPLDIKGDIGNINTSFNAEIIPHKEKGESFRFNFNIVSSDLSTLEDILKTDLPDIENIKVSGNVLLTEKNIQLEIENGVIGETALKGDIDYIIQKKRPKIIAKLKFSKLDLSFLENRSEEIKNKSKADKNNSLFSDDPLPFEQLKKMDADIDIDIYDIKHHFLELKHAALNATLKDGELKVRKIYLKNKENNELNAMLYINSVEARPAVEFMLISNNIDTEKNDTLSNYIKGVAINANINLKAKGLSVKELANHLNGKVIITASKGKIKSELMKYIGSNILIDLVNVINPVSKSETTSNLECAVLRLDIKDGIAVSDKGIAMQTDKIQIISSGVIDLKKEKLEFAIKPEARAGVSINLNSLASMVKLAGPIKHPKIEADLKGTAIVYSYFATGGATFIAKSLLDTTTRDIDPCKTAEAGIKIKQATPEKINDEWE